MSEAQSPPVRPAISKLGKRDLFWLPYFLARGFAELIHARLLFERIEARDLPLRNQAASQAAITQGRTNNGDFIARIAFVLPRISARLPWRSDCMIQAIAAQNWLSARGLPSEIRIGVERPDQGPFGAHAWLVHEDTVVTGGDISRYEVLLTQAGAGARAERKATPRPDTP